MHRFFYNKISVFLIFIVIVMAITLGDLSQSETIDNFKGHSNNDSKTLKYYLDNIDRKTLAIQEDLITNPTDIEVLDRLNYQKSRKKNVESLRPEEDEINLDNLYKETIEDKKIYEKQRLEVEETKRGLEEETEKKIKSILKKDAIKSNDYIKSFKEDIEIFMELINSVISQSVQTEYTGLSLVRTNIWKLFTKWFNLDYITDRSLHKHKKLFDAQSLIYYKRAFFCLLANMLLANLQEQYNNIEVMEDKWRADILREDIEANISVTIECRKGEIQEPKTVVFNFIKKDGDWKINKFTINWIDYVQNYSSQFVVLLREGKHPSALISDIEKRVRYYYGKYKNKVIFDLEFVKRNLE